MNLCRDLDRTDIKPRNKPLDFYKAKLERLRQAHNKDIDLRDKGRLTEAQLIRRAALREAEQTIIKHEIERNPKLEPYLLNQTFSFQAKNKYADNHDLGDLLALKFPMGKDDSEAGNGFFYISRKFMYNVELFLKQEAESWKVSETIGVILK